MATTVRNFLNKNAPTRIRVPESVTKVQNIQRDLKGNYSVQNAIDTTPGLSQLQKDNANTIASRMNKWGGSDEINNVLGKTNVNSIINDPVKALDPGDPNSISRQFASENDLKDPEKFKKDFNDDIQKLAAEDYTNLKTDAAKKMADGIKQKAGARTDAIKKYLKYAAIAGALAGSIAAILAAWANENSGCYIYKADGSQEKACKQSNCSEGSTCGNADGTPRSDGRCCDGGRRTRQGETCGCVEKTMNDAFQNIAGGIIDGLTSLVDTLTTGAGLFADFLTFALRNLPLMIVIILIIVFGPSILSAIRTTRDVFGSGDSRGSHTIRIETAQYRPPPTYGPPPSYTPSQYVQSGPRIVER